MWALHEYFISNHTAMDSDKIAGQELLASQSNSIPALFMESGQLLAAK